MLRKYVAVIAAAMSTATTSTTNSAMRVLRFIPRRAGFSRGGRRGSGGARTASVRRGARRLGVRLAHGVAGSTTCCPSVRPDEDLALSVTGRADLHVRRALRAVRIQHRHNARSVLRVHSRAGDGQYAWDFLGEDFDLRGHPALETRVALRQGDSHIIADHAGNRGRRRRHRDHRSGRFEVGHGVEREADVLPRGDLSGVGLGVGRDHLELVDVVEHEELGAARSDRVGRRPLCRSGG